MTLAKAARAFRGASEHYDRLLERTKDARFVLLGEASHGTDEFYRERAEITKRLIADHGVIAVAAEADWPDAYRVNLFVRGLSDDTTPQEALSDFERFPGWMWRNTAVVDFLAWLRAWNDGLPDGSPKVGFYGLDLYSLHSSMEAVVAYLDRVDPEAARRARERYACFDHFGGDPNLYAYGTGSRRAEPCELDVVEQLLELRRLAVEAASRDGAAEVDRRFYAEQNARLVVNAERYYRAVFRGGVETWNLRDRHMAETLEELTSHLERTQGPTKIAVWAHNSHVGDARATDMGARGELNIGQLVRERHPGQAAIVGFTTFTGTVTAASDWGSPAERKWVRPAGPGSWEELLHELGAPKLVFEPAGLRFAQEGNPRSRGFRSGATQTPIWGERRLERAIGVVYRPETERVSHYFGARLADQFDFVVHLDETHAVEPLERTTAWEEGELPETYPWAV